MASAEARQTPRGTSGALWLKGDLKALRARRFGRANGSAVGGGDGEGGFGGGFVGEAVGNANRDGVFPRGESGKIPLIGFLGRVSGRTTLDRRF